MLFVLKAIGSWLFKNPIAIVLTMALVAVSIVAAGKASDAAFYKAQSAERGIRVEVANQRIGTLVANQSLLANSISLQNQAIDLLAKATAESDAKFAASFVRLEQGRAATGAAVADLLNRVAPDDKCAGAFALVKEFAR